MPAAWSRPSPAVDYTPAVNGGMFRTGLVQQGSPDRTQAGSFVAYLDVHSDHCARRSKVARGVFAERALRQG
jgi:hypothetical protein